QVPGGAAPDAGGGAVALVGPVVAGAGHQLVGDGLPEDRAVGLGEAHDDPLVALDRRVAGPVVVGADEDLAPGEGRPAVGLGAQGDPPLDVLLLALGDGEVQGQALLGEVDEVALHAAAEERPAAGLLLLGLVGRLGEGGDVGGLLLAGQHAEDGGHNDPGAGDRQPATQGGGGGHGSVPSGRGDDNDLEASGVASAPRDFPRGADA